MTDDILLSKFASLEQCVKRVRDEYGECQGKLEEDVLRQDSIILNLQRACEQALDMGLRLIKSNHLGLPNEYREVFQLLEKNNVISNELSSSLQKMVGFRNIAIHEYQKLDLDRVKLIVEYGTKDLMAYAQALLAYQAA